MVSPIKLELIVADCDSTFPCTRIARVNLEKEKDKMCSQVGSGEIMNVEARATLALESLSGTLDSSIGSFRRCYGLGWELQPCWCHLASDSTLDKSKKSYYSLSCTISGHPIT